MKRTALGALLCATAFTHAAAAQAHDGARRTELFKLGVIHAAAEAAPAPHDAPAVPHAGAEDRKSVV